MCQKFIFRDFELLHLPMPRRAGSRDVPGSTHSTTETGASAVRNDLNLHKYIDSNYLKVK